MGKRIKKERLVRPNERVAASQEFSVAVGRRRFFLHRKFTLNLVYCSDWMAEDLARYGIARGAKPQPPVQPLAQSYLDEEVLSPLLRTPVWEALINASQTDSERKRGEAPLFATLEAADLVDCQPGALRYMVPGLNKEEAVTSDQITAAVDIGSLWIPTAPVETIEGEEERSKSGKEDNAWLPEDHASRSSVISGGESPTREKPAEQPDSTPAAGGADERKLPELGKDQQIEVAPVPTVIRPALKRCQVMIKKDNPLGVRPVPSLADRFLSALSTATEKKKKKKPLAGFKIPKKKSETSKEPSEAAIAPAQAYLSEDEFLKDEADTSLNKRKRDKPSAASPKQGGPKKWKRTQPVVTGGKTSPRKQQGRQQAGRKKGFQINVQELMFPGSSFVAPEEGDDSLPGLDNVGFRFHLTLAWHRNYKEYSKLRAVCTACIRCERPRCGVCAGCHITPGATPSSGYDTCMWRRCCFQFWRNESDKEKRNLPTNDVVLTRMWIQSVSTFCTKDFSEETKREIRDRLQLCSDVLGMTEEEERKFWLTDSRAFEYPRFDFPGGDKFSHIYKNYEIAQYEIAAHARRVKIRRRLNPDQSMQVTRHQIDLDFRSIKTVLTDKSKAGPPTKMVSTKSKLRVEKKVSKVRFRKQMADSEEDSGKWTTLVFIIIIRKQEKNLGGALQVLVPKVGGKKREARPKGWLAWVKLKGKNPEPSDKKKTNKKVGSNKNSRKDIHYFLLNRINIVRYLQNKSSRRIPERKEGRRQEEGRRAPSSKFIYKLYLCTYHVSKPRTSDDNHSDRRCRLYIFNICKITCLLYIEPPGCFRFRRYNGGGLCRFCKKVNNEKIFVFCKYTGSLFFSKTEVVIESKEQRLANTVTKKGCNGRPLYVKYNKSKKKGDGLEIINHQTGRNSCLRNDNFRGALVMFTHVKERDLTEVSLFSEPPGRDVRGDIPGENRRGTRQGNSLRETVPGLSGTGGVMSKDNTSKPESSDKRQEGMKANLSKKTGRRLSDMT